MHHISGALPDNLFHEDIIALDGNGPLTDDRQFSFDPLDIFDQHPEHLLPTLIMEFLLHLLEDHSRIGRLVLLDLDANK